MRNDEFGLAPGLVYLNHAAVAPWPRRSADAVARFAAENATSGALHYARWLATEHRLRERLRLLLGARSIDEIALVKNTSEGLSIVAFGLPWQSGDSVVGIARDFPSNRVVWEALGDRGVSFRPVDVNAAADPEGALTGACDASTRLMAVSWVHYVTGLTLDLERLGRFCRARGILLCVDGIQGVGALPIDVEACRIDFLAADGHKWLLGPEGLGVFYCRDTVLERLEPRQLGWHCLAHPGDYERPDWRLAPSAQRFEAGSPNLLGAHALDASLGLLLEIGADAIAGAIRGHAATLRAALEAIPGMDLLGSSDPARWSGIVTARIAGTDGAALVAQLAADGVVCAARGGGLRVSPHFYNEESELQYFCDVLSRFIKKC
jgi:selenocysteine lyase/cysteine desulfurase